MRIRDIRILTTTHKTLKYYYYYSNISYIVLYIHSEVKPFKEDTRETENKIVLPALEYVITYIIYTG